MNFDLIDFTNKTWPVAVDLKRAIWTTAAALDAGAPFNLFARGAARRDTAGNIVLVTGLWDLVLENAPRTDADALRTKGTVSINNSRVGPWTRGLLAWSAQPVGGGGAAKKVAMPLRTGSLRDDIVAAMRSLLPCSLGDARWDIIQPGSQKQVADGTYSKPGTSCLILPGFVTSYVGAVPHGWSFKGARRNTETEAYMNTRSLNGTGRVRDQGRKFSAWTQVNGNSLPRPGDIYALLDRDAKGIALTNRESDGIGHVGVVLNAGPNIWETADLGQGKGWDGSITTREYHAGIGELFGQSNQPGATKFRMVAGWVNVDDYFPNYKAQMANMPT